MKRVLFLLIALGILFSQLNLTTEILLEGDLTVVPCEEPEGHQPLEPMEDFPEENSEKEDSNKEGKDNDSKKFHQYRLFSKAFFNLTKASWAIAQEKQATKPFINKIQQPPEVSRFA